MKRKLTVGMMLFVMCVGVFAGWKETSGGMAQQTSVPVKTKLVWQSDSCFKRHEAYFNRVLEEKNLPYELEIVTEDTKTTEQQADLKTVLWTWKDTYDMTEEIKQGEFLALDSYLDSEEGQVIRQSLPENIWKTYQVGGNAYTVLTTGFVPKQTVYIWDRELAEKYDVHPETWNERIWEYADELKKVQEGEADREAFTVIEGLERYGECLKGLTPVLGDCYPVYINEHAKDGKAGLLYEMPEYQEYEAGIKKLKETGVYQPNVVTESAQKESFLKVFTDFTTADGYAAYYESEGFWETHAWKELYQEPLWRLSVCAVETGIAADSDHPDEAFSFLCLLYEDKDLVNALTWGEEGRDYRLSGNTAEDVMNGTYLPARYTGNHLIAHAEVGQDENKEELYPKLLARCRNSRINGFDFSGKACEQELNALYQAYEECQASDFDREDRIEKCREAGADKILEEWNRQYLEWNK